MDIGVLFSSSLQGSFLHEAGSDHDLGAVLASQIESSDTVSIGSFVGVGGLIVLVGLAVGSSVQLHAVIGALVEGLILQLAYVGDESNLVLAVLGSHFVCDVVGIGQIGVVGGLAAGKQTGDHGDGHEQCEELLHFLNLQKISLV